MLKEFRIPVPLTPSEYQIAQLYSTMKSSLNETGGGEGAEFLENKPINEGKGQFTRKLYHLQSKVPPIVRKIAPKDALKLEEQSWNTFPTSETIISNPSFMKDKFEIRVKSIAIGDDRGDLENVFSLDKDDLKDREIVDIDFATHEVDEDDVGDGEDPTKFKSAGPDSRGPLLEGWVQTHTPVTCIYKLITCKFKQWPFEKKVTEKIMDLQERLVVVFHRRLFCWFDEWKELNMEEIRVLEKEVQAELNRKRQYGQFAGVKKL